LAAGRRKKKPSLGIDKRSARAALVRQIMKKHGMSLPEASTYIKETGIPY
jgi:hypothetical protein